MHLTWNLEGSLVEHQSYYKQNFKFLPIQELNFLEPRFSQNRPLTGFCMSIGLASRVYFSCIWLPSYIYSSISDVFCLPYRLASLLIFSDQESLYESISTSIDYIFRSRKSVWEYSYKYRLYFQIKKVCMRVLVQVSIIFSDQESLYESIRTSIDDTTYLMCVELFSNLSYLLNTSPGYFVQFITVPNIICPSIGLYLSHSFTLCLLPQVITSYLTI